MRLHPLALALLLTGISAQSQATDLLQAYDLARQSDPVLSAAESQKKCARRRCCAIPLGFIAADQY